MKPARIDWHYLSQDLLMPAASLLAALLVWLLSAWYHGEQKARFDNYSSNQDAIHDEYDALVYRRRVIDRYHRRYREFQALGFVGRERRLDWVETIRTAARGLDVPSVSYALEPQLEVVRPVASAAPNDNIRIYLSRLEFELGLVHELDLLRFFSRLADEAPGLMKVDGCELARQADSVSRLLAETNILANCSVIIFSVMTSDISQAERGVRW